MIGRLSRPTSHKDTLCMLRIARQTATVFMILFTGIQLTEWHKQPIGIHTLPVNRIHSYHLKSSLTSPS